MRRITFGLMVLALTSLAAVEAHAQSGGGCNVSSDQETRRNTARESFMRGQEQFEADDYDGALASFECSFQNVPHPSTLYNIARAAELSGNFSRALDAWRGYLQMAPDAEDRAEIEQRIQGLEQASASAQPVNPGAMGGTDPAMTPTPTYTPSPPPAAAAAPTQWETPEGARSDVYTPNVAPGQEYQQVEYVPASPWRQYAWYIFGGGAALALVGIFLATPLLNLATDDEYSEENDGACYDAEADAAGDYYISSGCWISGAVLAGIGGAAMIASIFIWAFAERGGSRVVTRRAALFSPQLALGPEGQVSGMGGTLTLSF